MNESQKRIVTVFTVALTTVAFALSVLSLATLGLTVEAGAARAITTTNGGEGVTVDINGDGSAEVTLAPNITSSADSDVLTPDGTTADSLGSSLSEEISDAVGDMENGGGFIGAIIAIVVVIAIIIAVIALIPKKKM